ncbi:MAG: class I SAM-dependent methyltransferase [bacterium]|nr:class I SAM-dependent methyltransferase [bacterium]
MDFQDPAVQQAFFRIHSDLPREGPGSQEATRRALSMIVDLPTAPRVLDLGCGPGAQTRDLADAMPDARIVAVDNHLPFLRCIGESDKAVLRVLGGDMSLLPFRGEQFDLIWSEGAAYCIGIEAALEYWQTLLQPGGRLAFTEATWLLDRPGERVQTFWNSEYPAITTIEANLMRIADAGFENEGHFALDASAWWDDYYAPMQERLDELRVEYANDPVRLEVVKMHDAEIEIFKTDGDAYGYVFFIARKQGH